MQIHQVEERSRLYRDRSREAIALATQGKWKEAVKLNRAILASFPDDPEALNRLGKALSELGRYSEARSAFQRALKKSPSNAIARKNLDRLAHLKDSPAARPLEGLAPQLFIEERGKSTTTVLRNPAPTRTLAQVAAGDSVCLKVDGATIQVTTTGGAVLGHLEPKLAARLIKLMKAGNRYAAAVASASEHDVSVVLREVYQHPSQAGVVSFPARTGQDYRVYLPTTVLRHELAEAVHHGGRTT
jgi:tetratricopeptide (TPR) repeat protein